MTLQEILRGKGTLIYAIGPNASLDDVAKTLVRHNVGSLVVRDETGHMLGIITERDILRACAAQRDSLDRLRVADHMSTEIVTGAPNDSVEHIMGLMTVNRVRHMPVLEDGQLIGIISIGDVVKFQHAQLTMENHYLKTYIQGETDDQAVLTGTWRAK